MRPKLRPPKISFDKMKIAATGKTAKIEIMKKKMSK
jgi:hypothetical protein